MTWFYILIIFENISLFIGRKIHALYFSHFFFIIYYNKLKLACKIDHPSVFLPCVNHLPSFWAESPRLSNHISSVLLCKHQASLSTSWNWSRDVSPDRELTAGQWAEADVKVRFWDSCLKKNEAGLCEIDKKYLFVWKYFWNKETLWCM